MLHIANCMSIHEVAVLFALELSHKISGRSRGHEGRTSRVQLFSFSCVFRQKLCQIIGQSSPLVNPGSALLFLLIYKEYCLYVDINYLPLISKLPKKDWWSQCIGYGLVVVVDVMSLSAARLRCWKCLLLEIACSHR